MIAINKETAKLVAQVAAFCLLRRGQRCFPGWTAAKVFRYVAWHLLADCVFGVFGRKGEPQAVAFVRWADEADLRGHAERREPVFFWGKPLAGGDAIFIAEVVGKRHFISSIVEQVMAHWPDSPRKKLFTYRFKGGVLTLTEISWPTLTRFTYGRTQCS